MIDLETSLKNRINEFIQSLSVEKKGNSFRQDSLKRYIAIQMFLQYWTIEAVLMDEQNDLTPATQEFLTDMFEQFRTMSAQQLAEWSMRALEQASKEVV